MMLFDFFFLKESFGFVNRRFEDFLSADVSVSGARLGFFLL